MSAIIISHAHNLLYLCILVRHCISLLCLLLTSVRNAVAFWSYDIENDTCAICHNQLMLPCIVCEAEPHHAEDCSVAWGVCGHSYHFHCITRWLKTRSTCPLDDEEWDFVQY